MKRLRGCISIIIAMVLFFAANCVEAAEWRFPVGLTYVSGIDNVLDVYKNNLEVKGYIVDTKLLTSVGLSFQPYVQFSSGLGIGFTFGPAMIVSSTDSDFTAIPAGLDLRYTPLTDSWASPYIRAGIKKYFASGDYVKSSSPGFYGSFGLEFARTKRVGWGIEVTYDTAEITLDKYTRRTTTSYTSTYTISEVKVRPGETQATIFIVF